MKTLANEIASLLAAVKNCEKSCNDEWAARHQQRLRKIVKQRMPSGSGFDAGTTLDFDKSTPEKLVFLTSFHHMDDNGYYSGWTEHVVTVRASLYLGIDIKISGSDRNEIKDTIHSEFFHVLSADY